MADRPTHRYDSSSYSRHNLPRVSCILRLLGVVFASSLRDGKTGAAIRDEFDSLRKEHRRSNGCLRSRGNQTAESKLTSSQFFAGGKTSVSQAQIKENEGVCFRRRAQGIVSG